ncbi:hypothetical protein V8G54_032386 [Vigna mungo]|uniref:Uncharacterized protein n=1 Tax=Vigna mungo TaxID=3915 RepID=A0AAQ3RHU5_VIGMU
MSELRQCCGGSLSLLLLVGDPSGFGLALLHFLKVNHNRLSAKGIRFRATAIFFVGRSKSSDKSVETAPSLFEWTSAGCRRVRVSEVGTAGRVDLGFAKLVQVLQEFNDVCSTAPC